MQRVNATCFGALTASACFGAWNYANAGVVNYPLAVLTSLPGMLFIRYGVSVAQRINSKHLASMIGFGMLANVPAILLKCDSVKRRLPEWVLASSSVSSPGNSLDLQHYRAGLVETLQGLPRAREFYDKTLNDPLGFLRANVSYLGVGAVAGFLSGLCGVGGSMITITYLATATDMPQSVVVGTTFMSALPVCVPTNYYNFKAQLIRFPTSLKLGVSLIAGVYGTTTFILSEEVPEDLLRSVFAGLVAVAGFAMIRRPI